MRHLRMVGLSLVAVFAVTAIAATSASALPEFGKCVVAPTHEGKYTNSVCTTKAKKVNEKFTGEFAFKTISELKAEGAHLKFTGKGGAGVLVTTFRACVRGDQNVNPTCEGKEEEKTLGPLKVECESENAGGALTGPTTIGNIVVKFHGCKLFGSSPCQNTSTEGEIAVNVLKGTIGFINKTVSPREVGLLLNPAKSKGEFAKFTCLGTITTVVGVGPSKAVGTKGEQVTLKCFYPEPHCGGDGIISPVTPVNTMTTELTQVYTVNAKEENIPSKFEGKPIELLEDLGYSNNEPEYVTAWSAAGEEITNVNTSEEVGEIKAN
jgi:hypothetical protein